MVTIKFKIQKKIKASVTLACLLFTTTVAQAEWTGGIEGGTVLSGDENATRVRLRLANDIKPLSHYLYICLSPLSRHLSISLYIYVSPLSFTFTLFRLRINQNLINNTFVI